MAVYINRVWNKQGWETPIITEDFEPERITLSLSFKSESNDLSTAFDKKALIKKALIKTDEKKRIIEQQKEIINEYLTEHVTCKSKDIANLLGIKLTRVRDILAKMIADGI